MSEKLAIGEKYLNIQVLGSLRVAAFKNKNKTKASQPDYVGNGVAVWISAKKEAKKNSEDEDL